MRLSRQSGSTAMVRAANRPRFNRATAAVWFTALLCVGLLTVPAGAADPVPTDADRVAILDAGTFLRIEAHGATLGEVLDRLKTQLNIRVTNSKILDLAHAVEGSMAGTPREIVDWLAPGASFILIFEPPKPGESEPHKLERIGFLGPGNAKPSPAGGSRAAGSAAPPAPASTNPRSVTVTRLPNSGQSAATVTALGDRTKGGLKPDSPPSAPNSEIKGVAEQLQAGTPEAQLAIEQHAHSPDPQTPPPGFLQPNQDVAETTLQQQQERSQALAVEQLRALMGAYQSACPRGAARAC
jgi:hypothetical protein